MWKYWRTLKENVTIVSGVTLNYTYCVSACDSSCKKYEENDKSTNFIFGMNAVLG